MNGGPSGFNNAPVTKTFVIACALFTLFFGIQGPSFKLGFSYQVFILFSVMGSFLFEVMALAILKDPTANLLISGPYGLIFASFIPFYFDIPVSRWFRIFGVRFSDKSFIYLAGLQLLLSSWKRSLLPGICGILASSLYRLNVFRIRRAKFPEFIASFFSLLSWPFMGYLPTTPTRNLAGNVPSYTTRQVVRTYPSTVAPSAAEPPEDSIATLVSMGFDRNSARQALCMLEMTSMLPQTFFLKHSPTNSTQKNVSKK